MNPGFSCSNKLCRIAPPARAIDRIHAIGVFSGALQKVVHQYKYENKSGWSIIFGRLLTGWLQDNPVSGAFTHIMANPSYAGPTPGGSLPGHTDRVVLAAATEDVLDCFPFDTGTPRILVKSKPTGQSAGKGWAAKQAAAVEHAQAIQVTRPDALNGAIVLLYDDVCTTGQQLDEVARLLKAHGAIAVNAIVLGRMPWT